MTTSPNASSTVSLGTSANRGMSTPKCTTFSSIVRTFVKRRATWFSLLRIPRRTHTKTLAILGRGKTNNAGKDFPEGARIAVVDFPGDRIDRLASRLQQVTSRVDTNPLNILACCVAS